MIQPLSIGLFIDGGYYAKIDEALRHNSGLGLDLKKLMHFIRTTVAEHYDTTIDECQIVESHYFRGRYRANLAEQKRILFPERRFEDALIENDVIFHYKHLREIDGTIIEKGIDVWYALEAYELATVRHFDVVVLITGDADHEMLIRKLKALKSNVILLTGELSSQSAVSRLLKEEATLHIDLGVLFANSREAVEDICTERR